MVVRERRMSTNSRGLGSDSVQDTQWQGEQYRSRSQTMRLYNVWDTLLT